MIDPQFLQSFLKLNHTSDQMSETEVRSVLQNAGWSTPEIESALILLKSGKDTTSVPQVASYTHFRPDMEFSSSELSRLLGIDVRIDPSVMGGGEATATLGGQELLLRILFGSIIAVVSLSCAVAIGLLSARHFGIDLAPVLSALW